MAFHISKQGNPEVLLTDGGSLQLGTGLSIDNGTLNVTGGGGSTAPSFSDIIGNPEDNEKLRIVLNSCIKRGESVNNFTLNDKLTIGDTINSELTQNHLLFTDSDLEVEIGKEFIRIKDGENEQFITWEDLIKLINGENENYLRHSVEGLVISSSLNDLNSRILDSDSNIEELQTKVSDLAELPEVVTSLEERVTNIEQSSDEELVISSALNDLNNRLLVVEQKLATI